MRLCSTGAVVTCEKGDDRVAPRSRSQENGTAGRQFGEPGGPTRNEHECRLRCGCPLVPVQVRQQLAALLVVNGPPVVGINQTEVPEFLSLVDVRHSSVRIFKVTWASPPGRVQSRRFLPRRTPPPSGNGCRDVAPYRRGHEIPNGLIVGCIRADPARASLGLPRRLLHVSPEPFDEFAVLPFVEWLQRPDSHQSLVAQRTVAATGAGSPSTSRNWRRRLSRRQASRSSRWKSPSVRHDETGSPPTSLRDARGEWR